MFPFIDEVKTVMSLLNEKGTSYLVGGAIRNYYFNTEIIDYDIATSLDVCDIELALSSFKTKV